MVLKTLNCSLNSNFNFEQSWKVQLEFKSNKCSLNCLHKAWLKREHFNQLNRDYDQTFTSDCKNVNIEFIILSYMCRFSMHFISQCVIAQQAMTANISERKPYLSHRYPLSSPLFMNAAPIWFPSASPSLIQKLKNIQNSALRIVTGCVEMTSINQLHDEAKMLPVQDHFSLISSQYLARALQPNYPSHSIVTYPLGI